MPSAIEGVAAFREVEESKSLLLLKVIGVENEPFSTLYVGRILFTVLIVLSF